MSESEIGVGQLLWSAQTMVAGLDFVTKHKIYIHDGSCWSDKREETKTKLVRNNFLTVKE